MKSDFHTLAPLLVLKISVSRSRRPSLKAARGPFPAGISKEEGGRKEGKGISMEMRG